MVAQANASSRTRPKKSREVVEVKQMQRAAFAMAMDETLPAEKRAIAMRTYDVLADRRRILKGKPLPGAFKPETRSAKRLHAQNVSMLAHAAAFATAPDATQANDAAGVDENAGNVGSGLGAS